MSKVNHELQTCSNRVFADKGKPETKAAAQNQATRKDNQRPEVDQKCKLARIRNNDEGKSGGFETGIDF